MGTDRHIAVEENRDQPRLVTRADLDRMVDTPGTCAYCLRETMVYALIEFTCRRCVLEDIDAHAGED